MKAVVVTATDGPGSIEVKEMATPEPAAGEVRVALRYAALNRRDYWITVGKYAAIELPAVCGSDGAGVIDEVGDGVDAGRIGEEVVIYPALAWGDDPVAFGPDFRVLGMPDQGTLAEYICVPAENAMPRPPYLSWEQSAAFPLAGLTAWRAVVTQAEVKPGSKVLVTGAGSGVSTFALLWARHHGAEVYVTSGSAEKIEAACANGAAGGANYREGDWGKQLRGMAGGFDAIIDSAGGDGVFECLGLLNAGGRYVFFGATTGHPKGALPLTAIFFKHLRIQGTTMGTPDEFRAMLAFMNEHRIEPTVDSVLPMSDAAAAFQRLGDFQQTGKIVLDLSAA